MTRRDHWERVYASNPRERLGWHRPHLEISLRWIEELDLRRDAPIIDVGGGASTLADDLVARGFTNLSVLDVSATALDVARDRVGSAAAVDWIQDDVTSAHLGVDRYDLWHDRAAFHFLTDEVDRSAYLATMQRAIKPGGHAILGVFAPEAPERCSGLPVTRYDARELAETVGKAFELQRHQKELHVTPGGTEQMYLYALFRHTPE